MNYCVSHRYKLVTHSLNTVLRAAVPDLLTGVQLVPVLLVTDPAGGHSGAVARPHCFPRFGSSCSTEKHVFWWRGGSKLAVPVNQTVCVVLCLSVFLLASPWWTVHGALSVFPVMTRDQPGAWEIGCKRRVNRSNFWQGLQRMFQKRVNSSLKMSEVKGNKSDWLQIQIKHVVHFSLIAQHAALWHWWTSAGEPRSSCWHSDIQTNSPAVVSRELHTSFDLIHLDSCFLCERWA